MKNHFCPWGDFFLKKEIVFISTSPTPPVLIPLSSKLVFDHHRFPPPKRNPRISRKRERKKKLSRFLRRKRRGGRENRIKQRRWRLKGGKWKKKEKRNPTPCLSFALNWRREGFNLWCFFLLFPPPKIYYFPCNLFLLSLALKSPQFRLKCTGLIRWCIFLRQHYLFAIRLRDEEGWIWSSSCGF